MLIKGYFTRDEWNNLLHLFNISHFSSTCCTKTFSLMSYTRKMAKRSAGTKVRRQDCGKIKAHGNELEVNCLDKFLIRETIRLRRRARGYSKHQQGNLTRGQEEVQYPTQRRVLKEGWLKWVAPQLPRSLFLLPRHKNTQHSRYNKSNSENTPVHHAHLQAPSVDELRHQESLWREDLRSGGNQRTTTPKKEGKSKVIASCGFVDNELCQYSKEGVTMDDSVETMAST